MWIWHFLFFLFVFLFALRISYLNHIFDDIEWLCCHMDVLINTENKFILKMASFFFVYDDHKKKIFLSCSFFIIIQILFFPLFICKANKNLRMLWAFVSMSGKKKTTRLNSYKVPAKQNKTKQKNRIQDPWQLLLTSLYVFLTHTHKDWKAKITDVSFEITPKTKQKSRFISILSDEMNIRNSQKKSKMIWNTLTRALLLLLKYS